MSLNSFSLGSAVLLRSSFQILFIYKSNQTFHFPGSAGSWKATGNTESIQDRAFISEHCLPFTVAPELLEFAKWLSEEKQALGKTTILKSNAYINTHGVAKSLKNDLKQKLKWQMLSLKADEATNNNNDKILNFIFFFIFPVMTVLMFL